MNIKLTQISAVGCAMAKSYSRGADGKIEKTAIANMTEGVAKVVELENLSQLKQALSLLQSNQAITCGVPIVGDTPLTTRAGAEFRPDAVARTNEAFKYPQGPALFPIDVDIDDERRNIYLSVDDVLDALEVCSPWLKYVYRVARPSSSSFVDGEGLRGVHVYLAVTRGTDIPALGKRMQREQWAAGLGYMYVSKSGALLTRQLSDALVYQPSRLLFEASPVLRDGVARTVPADQAFRERPPIVSAGHPVKYKVGDGMLDAQALPAESALAERKFDTAVRAEKDKQRREAKRVAIAYQTANATANGLDAQLGERLGLLAIRALGDRKLPPSWEIAVKDIGRVKVADILANRGDAIGHQCADPFDTWRPNLKPEGYGKAEIVAMGGKLGVWSHKLQTFFEFTDDSAADLASPLEQAAEKLCGTLEYPERVGKRVAPFVNVKFALASLLEKIDAVPRYNAATYTTETAGLPSEGKLIDALSRVGCAGVVPGVVERAIETLAIENQFDPWRDAVLSLPQWDGRPRLDTFFPDLCGATDSDALRLTGQVMFAGALMRQMEPGIDCHVVPVLIGGKGAGKSHFVTDLAAALGVPKPAALAFSDPIRMSMAACGSVFAELGEMSGMGKRDVEEIKLWIADGVDKYRAPYERKAEPHPRRFVLIGTANKDELNHDETGNRRFMPVQFARRPEPNWAVECRQIFAEAKARFCQSSADYLALHRATTDAIGAFNDARMRHGGGTPQTVVSEFAPPIVQRLAAQRADRRVYVSALLTQLAASSTATRSVTPRQVGAWMRMNGWTASTSNGMTYYVVPDDYLAEGTDNAVVLATPFARPALAVAN